MALLSRYNPPDFSENQVKADKQIGRYALFIALLFTAIIWLIKLFEIEYNLDFSEYGVAPLEIKGLRGILLAPLIHSNFEHLMANTIPLFVLTFSLFFFYRKAFLIFITIYLLTGLCVWLFGREALHIGASGIIYGLAAFLFLSGILSKNSRLLTISLIVAFLYGSLFWGIFPLKPDISWESHLWGGVIGFGAALVWGRSSKAEELEEDEDKDEEIPTDDF